MSKEEYTVAAFDFDGTITTKDTLFDFIAFYHGKAKLIKGLCVLSPILIAFKAGIISNSTAKEKLFSFFFKGESADKYNQICQSYANRITSICNQSTLEKINSHKQQNHKLIIVSASNANWIKPWAVSMGFDQVLGTEIEVKDEKLSGKFSSPNCYGKEKANRLLALYPNRSEYVLYAYGDSNGDKELLALADYPTLIKK